MEDIKWLSMKKVDMASVSKLLEPSFITNQYTNYGPGTQALETYIRRIYDICDDKAVILTSNGTTAIHALVSGLNIFYEKHLQFVTQSFTFPSSNQGPLESAHIVDIDSDGGLDISVLESYSFDGIIVTNILGNVTDINKYVTYVKENDKLLIFDNAATGYTYYNGINSLNFGTASTMSFHHTKPFGFGEGGCIIVDSKYENVIRHAINFGIDNTKGEHARYSPMGSNYRMSDIAAVFIHAYHEKNFDLIVGRHKEIYHQFAGSSLGQYLFPNFSSETPVCSCICLLLPKVVKPENLPFLIRKYYKPLVSKRVSNDFYQHIICVPCNIDLTNEQVTSMIRLIEDSIN
jgi:dTDP-4-amino-4,6-dideoxygalactose transaminase